MAVTGFCAQGAATKSSRKPTTTKSTAGKKTSKKRTARVPRAPRVSAEVKAESAEMVQARIAGMLDDTIQNPAALVPFFERLYRAQQGEPGPVRVLQFGDSHTASDDWVGAIREKFQTQFGVGGPGFVHAGRPFLGFRRFDAKATMSGGWKPEGLLNREGSGLYGLSGVSLNSQRSGEIITLDAEGASMDVYYYHQAGGGSFDLSIDGVSQGIVDTIGEAGPGYVHHDMTPGTHHLMIRTTTSAPVRLFGWVVENGKGVTWETLGINGAQVDLLLGWNETVLKSNLQHRDPALIVLAYGTNEARRPDWTYETYKSTFVQVLRRLRDAAPTASILVIGPPDQSILRGGQWSSDVDVDKILTAQHDAALESGCAFWNIRAGMGGRGSMKQWVYAGFAQGDFVHFTSPGYRMLGESLYGLLISQYGVFTTVRRQWIGSSLNGSPSQNR